MNKTLVLCLLIVALFAFSFSEAKRHHKTALDRYVYDNDHAFNWKVNSTISHANYTGYVLELTSVSWLTYAETDTPLWQHWLVVCVPNQVTRKTAFLWIDGKTKSQPVPTTVYAVPHAVCMTGSVGAVLWQIPNEPIVFKDDLKNLSRVEDAIIAYTWRHFLNNTDNRPEWILQFPMTKAAVKAMDAIQDFTGSLRRNIRPTKFVVGGASKRGWVTWLTGAVDDRVTAIVPVVIPVLNIVPNFNAVYQNIGEWGFALDDYVNEGIFNFLNKPDIERLADLIDPITYNERFAKKPKFVITASLDQFFPPDAANIFFKELKGQKFYHLAPNAGHNIAQTYGEAGVANLIMGFFLTVVEDGRDPKLDWILREGNSTGHIFAFSRSTPKKVLKWTATTDPNTNRDFRANRCLNFTNPYCFAHITWVSEEVQPSIIPGMYTASQQAPAIGQWTGFFLQFTYDIPLSDGTTTELVISTEVNIVPDWRPFPFCGDHCQ